MLHIDVKLGGEGVWPDLAARQADIIDVSNASAPIRVATLDRALKSGLPGVALRIDLADGKVVVAQTSARLFCTVAKMIMAKYPHLFMDAEPAPGSAVN